MPISKCVCLFLFCLMEIFILLIVVAAPKLLFSSNSDSAMMGPNTCLIAPSLYQQPSKPHPPNFVYSAPGLYRNMDGVQRCCCLAAMFGIHNGYIFRSTRDELRVLFISSKYIQKTHTHAHNTRIHFCSHLYHFRYDFFTLLP